MGRSKKNWDFLVDYSGNYRYDPDAPGTKGEKGDAGAAGTNGIDGIDGLPGEKGDQGDTVVFFEWMGTVATEGDLPVATEETKGQVYVAEDTGYLHVSNGDGTYYVFEGIGIIEGPPGEDGKSAYEIYLEYTTDNPPLTEEEWINQLDSDDKLIKYGDTVDDATADATFTYPDVGIHWIGKGIVRVEESESGSKIVTEETGISLETDTKGFIGGAFHQVELKTRMDGTGQLIIAAYRDNNPVVIASEDHIRIGQSFQMNGTEVIRVTNNGTQKDAQYIGTIVNDDDMVNKKYVDENIGATEVCELTFEYQNDTAITNATPGKFSSWSYDDGAYYLTELYFPGTERNNVEAAFNSGKVEINGVEYTFENGYWFDIDRTDPDYNWCGYAIDGEHYFTEGQEYVFRQVCGCCYTDTELRAEFAADQKEQNKEINHIWSDIQQMNLECPYEGVCVQGFANFLAPGDVVIVANNSTGNRYTSFSLFGDLGDFFAVTDKLTIVYDGNNYELDITQVRVKSHSSLWKYTEIVCYNQYNAAINNLSTDYGAPFTLSTSTLCEAVDQKSDEFCTTTFNYNDDTVGWDGDPYEMDYYIQGLPDDYTEVWFHWEHYENVKATYEAGKVQIDGVDYDIVEGTFFENTRNSGGYAGFAIAGQHNIFIQGNSYEFRLVCGCCYNDEILRREIDTRFKETYYDIHDIWNEQQRQHITCPFECQIPADHYDYKRPGDATVLASNNPGTKVVSFTLYGALKEYFPVGEVITVELDGVVYDREITYSGHTNNNLGGLRTVVDTKGYVAAFHNLPRGTKFTINGPTLCSSSSGDFLGKYGETVDDATVPAEYSWNEEVSIKSDKGIEIDAGPTNVNELTLKAEGAEVTLGNSDTDLAGSLGLANDRTFNIGPKGDEATNPIVSLSSGTNGLLEAKYLGSITDKKHIATKEYVDNNSGSGPNVTNEIHELEAEIDVLAPAVERGQWEYEVPTVLPYIGTAELVIPSYVQQITDYTFEVQWDGNINESDCTFEWKATLNGNDVSADVFSQHTNRTSGVNAAKVTARFTEEDIYKISCKVDSNVSTEQFETSESSVDVQFFDNIAKIGDIVLAPKEDALAGEMITYVPENNGDADDVQYTFSATKKGESVRPRIFDRERCMAEFERALKHKLPEYEYNTQVEFVQNAMDRWEALFRYPEDLFWSLWHSSRKGKFDEDHPDDAPRNQPWSGLYFTVDGHDDPNTAVMATCGPNGDYDNSVQLNDIGTKGHPRSHNLWLNTYLALRANRNPNETEEQYRFAYEKLWVHEIGHGFLLCWLPSGWYKQIGYPEEYYDNSIGHVFHESYYPRTVQAYREIVGDDSFDRIHGKAPREGHWPWMAQSFDGVTYPGWKGIMSTGAWIDKVCVGLMVDHGWEEVNPGTSEDDNPEIVRTFVNVADVETDDPLYQHILAHYETSQYYTPHEHIQEQVQTAGVRNGGGVDMYEPADEDYWGPGVKDFSTPIESTIQNQYNILIKAPSTWTIATTATSAMANDGPKTKEFDQVVLSSETNTASLFSNPYNTLITDPGPGKYHLFDANSNPTGDFTAAALIKFSNEDASGEPHDWADVTTGKKIQLFNQSSRDYLQGDVTFANPGGDSVDYFEISVDLDEASQGTTDDSDLGRLKIFSTTAGLANEILELEAEIEAIAPSVERGKWEYEVPTVTPHIGSVELVIPSQIQQITEYTFEVKWDGNIEEADCVFEWTAKKGNTDVSSTVFRVHNSRSVVGAAKVTAYFTDEAVHAISCKVTSQLSSEVLETPTTNVDVQFFDGIPKIGDVVLNPINNYKMGQTATYTPSSLGDADDVKYTFAYSQKTTATRPKIFDRQRVIDDFEQNVIPSIQNDMKQYFRDTVVYSMDLWETYIQYNEDVYWSMWHSSRASKFDPSKDDDHPWNLPWNGYYLEWSAYQSDSDGALAWGGTNGDHDSSVNIPYTTTFSNPRSGNVRVNMHFANYGNVGWSKEYTQAYFRTTIPHEIGHCLGLFIPTRGWYEHDGVDRFEENTGVYHYAQYPNVVQAYRDLTGDQSFDRVYNNYGDGGHVIGYPRTWHGKLYPGVQSLMSVVGGEHRKLTLMEIKLAVDLGWEEINPGSSAEPNPPLFYTQTTAVAAATDEFHPEGFIECTGEDHASWLDRLPYINEPFNPKLRSGGGAPSDYGPTSAPGYSSGVKDFSSPLVRTETDSTLSIVFKKPEQWEVTATATSATANDGPKSKKITQTALAMDVRAIDLFTNPYDVILSNPRPGKYHLIDANGDPTATYSSAVKVRFSNKDSEGGDHTWSEVEVGKTVQILNQSSNDYLLGEVAAVSKGDYAELDLTADASRGSTEERDLGRLKIFTVSSGNASDFLMKAGDTIGEKEGGNYTWNVDISNGSSNSYLLHKLLNKNFERWQYGSNNILTLATNKVTVHTEFLVSGAKADLNVTNTLYLGNNGSTNIYTRGRFDVAGFADSRIIARLGKNASATYRGTGGKGQVLHSEGNDKPPYWGDLDVNLGPVLFEVKNGNLYWVENPNN